MDTEDVLAFSRHDLLARGTRAAVALAILDSAAHAGGETVLLFEGATGRQFDLDLSGPREAVVGRLEQDEAGPPAEEGPRRRGRPKLGVIGREVTLLPRHWEWLEGQRGGASATLRRLVDEARRADAGGDVRRRAQDRTQRFMAALAGDLPGFEEAARALYAGDGARFEAETAPWPGDVRAVAREFAADAFGADAA